MADRVEAVRNILSSIESEQGRLISYAVAPAARRVGHAQVNVYPAFCDAGFRIFNLHDGVTATMRQAIREWFEPFMVSD